MGKRLTYFINGEGVFIIGDIVTDKANMIMNPNRCVVLTEIASIFTSRHCVRAIGPIQASKVREHT